MGLGLAVAVREGGRMRGDGNQGGGGLWLNCERMLAVVVGCGCGYSPKESLTCSGIGWPRYLVAGSMWPVAMKEPLEK